MSSIAFNILILSAALIAVAVIALPRWRSIDTGPLVFLRVFVPSWRFFDEIHHTPKLYYRIGPSADQLGDWTLCRVRRERRLSHLFLNPDINLDLAAATLSERFVSEASRAPDGTDLEETVSYKLLREVVRSHLRHCCGPDQRGTRFQFKISLATLLNPGLPEHDFLVSPEYEV